MIRAWCHKCNKPCDELLRKENDYQHSLVYVAVCHGEAQEQIVPVEWIFSLDKITDIKIDAFKELNGIANDTHRQRD